MIFSLTLQENTLHNSYSLCKKGVRSDVCEKPAMLPGQRHRITNLSLVPPPPPPPPPTHAHFNTLFSIISESKWDILGSCFYFEHTNHQNVIWNSICGQLYHIHSECANINSMYYSMTPAASTMQDCPQSLETESWSASTLGQYSHSWQLPLSLQALPGLNSCDHLPIWL